MLIKRCHSDVQRSILMIDEEGQDGAGGGHGCENRAIAAPAPEHMQLRVNVFFIAPRANGDKVAV